MEWLLTGNNLYIVLWLVLMVVFVITELVTVGLTSIWFAVGALCALIAGAVDASFGIQVVIFIAISLVLLFATRPFARKFINTRMVKTNSESLVGEVIRITERVSNIDQTGTAVVKGQEWTVRTDNDNDVIEQGELAKIVRITGVKLIVERNKEE